MVRRPRLVEQLVFRRCISWRHPLIVQLSGRFCQEKGLSVRVRRMPGMAVRAVIFDWGGTLTPWHSIDLGELWLAVCARHFPAREAADKAAGVRAAELDMWREGERSNQSATLERIFDRAGVAVSDEFLA